LLITLSNLELPWRAHGEAHRVKASQIAILSPTEVSGSPKVLSFGDVMGISRSNRYHSD